MAEYVKAHPTVADEVTRTAKDACVAYTSKNLPLLPPHLEPASYEQEALRAYGAVLDGKATVSGEGVPGDVEAKIKMHHKTMQSASKALSEGGKESSAFYAGVNDVLLPYLDSLHGSTISPDDHGIFTKLTQHWERRFKEDLRLLNCLPPTITTRVSEFVEEIVAFVKRIQDKGFAYATADGSVYFDIHAFEAAGNCYARLDFALWKASKPGEPSWTSPWGRGRPGWHIECSAMASEVLGSRIDIHSGGIDLAFPHHDNELAQSEAYWVDTSTEAEIGAHEYQHRWINYFLHMGHLSIQGSKMSKSLKNFTTIEAALSGKGGWTARALRIVFLLGGWKERIEVTDDVVSRAGTWEATVNVRSCRPRLSFR